MILDDEELEKQSIPWRQHSQNVDMLFRNKKSNFPKAFQSYKQALISRKPGALPVKIVDLSGIVFTPEFICKHGVPLLSIDVEAYPYAPMTPPGEQAEVLYK